MEPYRPDRVVKVLTALISIAYFGLAIVGALVLIGGPAIKLFVSEVPNFTWSVEVPVKLPGDGVSVATAWGPASLVFDRAEGSLRLPLWRVPWWLLGLLWLHAAAALALMLRFLYHLRRIFQRVHDGAPFDADNALRLRWLGVLLLALAGLDAFAKFAAATAVRRGLTATDVAIPVGLHVNGSLVLVAFAVIVLAAIFRRGADLEREQSLVV